MLYSSTQLLPLGQQLLLAHTPKSEKMSGEQVAENRLEESRGSGQKDWMALKNHSSSGKYILIDTFF